MKHNFPVTFIASLIVIILSGCGSMQELHTAALEGDLVKVKDLSNKGNSINAKSSLKDQYEGFTPLHMALNNGHKDVALYLINGGADLNVTDKLGRTPLHLAAYNGMPQVAKTLISRRVSVNAATIDGSTPLHSAAIGIKNNKILIKQLLSKGADINSGRGSTSGTPLIQAARYGNAEIAEMLIKHGADVNATDASGNTALHIAALFGRLKYANVILKNNPDVNAKNSSNNTPLHIAAINGWRMLAEELVYHGANLMAKNESGESPLKCAEKNSKDTIVAFLEPFTEPEKEEVAGGKNQEPSILSD